MDNSPYQIPQPTHITDEKNSNSRELDSKSIKLIKREDNQEESTGISALIDQFEIGINITPPVYHFPDCITSVKTSNEIDMIKETEMIKENDNALASMEKFIESSKEETRISKSDSEKLCEEIISWIKSQKNSGEKNNLIAQKELDALLEQLNTKLESENKMKFENLIFLFRIEEGTEAVVSKYFDHITRKSYALRVSKKKFEVENHLNELETIITIIKSQDKSLIQFYRVYLEEGRLHILMECGYGDLKAFLKYMKDEKENFFPEELKFYFVKQIAEQFEKLSELSVIHRNLKPENMLILKDFRLKFIDFGLAEIFSSTETVLKPDKKYTSLYSHPDIAKALFNDAVLDYGNLINYEKYSLEKIVEKDLKIDLGRFELKPSQNDESIVGKHSEIEKGFSSSSINFFTPS